MSSTSRRSSNSLSSKVPLTAGRFVSASPASRAASARSPARKAVSASNDRRMCSGGSSSISGTRPSAKHSWRAMAARICCRNMAIPTAAAGSCLPMTSSIRSARSMAPVKHSSSARNPRRLTSAGWLRTSSFMAPIAWPRSPASNQSFADRGMAVSSFSNLGDAGAVVRPPSGPTAPSPASVRFRPDPVGNAAGGGWWRSTRPACRAARAPGSERCVAGRPPTAPLAGSRCG